MATQYFKKENIRSTLFDTQNIPVVFIPVFGGDGVIELDDIKDKDKIEFLDGMAKARKGGVVKISPEIYESLKKNGAGMPSPRPSLLNQMRVSPSPESFGLKVVPPAVAVKPASGIRIMEEPLPPSSVSQFKARSRPIKPGVPAS